MATTLTIDQRLTPEEFLAMVEERPDGEHWELIEGIAIMNPSPIDWHQQIVLNIGATLLAVKKTRSASWSILPGISTKVPASPGSLPRPDLFVMEGPQTGSHTTSDALIMFEVLSRSNRKNNQAWRRRVYASIPNCQHYVTVGMKSSEVVRYDRLDNWRGSMMHGLETMLELPIINVGISLRDIYEWTPIK